MKTNTKRKPTIFTHEGAPAVEINAEAALRRSVMACLLWEKSFYESGEDIATRIATLIPQVDPVACFNIAIEAKDVMKLRHVPLYMAIEMLTHPKHKAYVAHLLEHIIQRADELTEVFAMYWKDGKKPVAHQLRKGVARAFHKFNAYHLAKYNRDGAVKLRDALFLSHAKPKDDEEQLLWERLIKGELTTPDTWEVALSAATDKKAAWERLLSERKLGGMALLKNLRNILAAGCSHTLLRNVIKEIKSDRLLPFQFVTAARYAPAMEPELEQVMIDCLEGEAKLPGHTVLLVDVSGSMNGTLSSKGETTRMDAAAGLAILLREICETVSVFTFSDKIVRIPSRRGFALKDLVITSQPHSGTELDQAIKVLNLTPDTNTADRLIVITDEQAASKIPDPVHKKAYMVNVSCEQHGVGYKRWTHIDGWSEGIIKYIRELEK